MKLEATKRLSALTDKQKQLDVNKDGKISGDDLKKIREGKKPTKTEASTKVLASFNPSALVRDGADEAAVKILQTLHSHLHIKYAQYENTGASTLEAYLFPTDDSSVSEEKVFSVPQIVELGKAVSALSRIVDEVEMAINTDDPHKPFLQLVISNV